MPKIPSTGTGVGEVRCGEKHDRIKRGGGLLGRADATPTIREKSCYYRKKNEGKMRQVKGKHQTHNIMVSI